ncbi:hypothetical protein [Pantoea eucrina]|uniref:hypothetical protein n=1 Tax=Pantoea eucrina TaxID=472693 RepID=UPI000FE140D1|nr:hypothetical protein [Pantoea eucrina]
MINIMRQLKRKRHAKKFGNFTQIFESAVAIPGSGCALIRRQLPVMLLKTASEYPLSPAKTKCFEGCHVKLCSYKFNLNNAVLVEVHNGE